MKHAQKNTIAAIIGAVALVLVVAALLGQYFYRSHYAKAAVTNAIGQFSQPGINYKVGSVDVGFWPWSGATLHNVTYEVAKLHSVVTVDRVDISKWSKSSISLRFSGGHILMPNSQKKLAKKLSGDIAGRVNYQRHGKHITLTPVYIAMEGVGAIQVTGSFALPADSDLWAQVLVDRLTVAVTDDGMMATQAKATRALLGPGVMIRSEYQSLYHRAVTNLGPNQSKWPALARLYMVALSAEADSTIDHVKLTYAPEQPVAMGTVVMKLMQGLPMPALMVDLPKPGALN